MKKEIGPFDCFKDARNSCSAKLAIGFLFLLAYVPGMHEMSLTASLLAIVRQEMEKHGTTRLLLVRVRYGALANVVPEALDMAFEVMTSGTELEGARLELNEEPVRLACGGCSEEFMPRAVATALFSPCPKCGEEIGHLVLAGKELYIDHIEVE